MVHEAVAHARRFCSSSLLIALHGMGRATSGEPRDGNVPVKSALSHPLLLMFAGLMPEQKGSGDTYGLVSLTWVNLG